MTNKAKLTDEGDGDQNVMIVAYRHDAHKMTGESHDSAPDSFNGVQVNQTVPHGADGDASALSRPSSPPEQTVNTHETHYRLSLVTGEGHHTPETFSRTRLSEDISDLLTGTDPEVMHQLWLKSNIAGGFNESVYYPFTSLKYHTLLVAALLDNYRAGHEFADLCLVVDPSEEIVPHRTVYDGEEFTLRIDAGHGNRPFARLGNRPWRSWASTWNRLTAHPLDADTDAWDRTLDANLRRIRSWSTALQYIEDFQDRSDRP